MTMAGALGFPRLHLRQTDSTNLRARELAAAGAPHGTLVTAGQQSAGRGRQGRVWSAPPGRALLLSLLLRDPRPLLPLAAGVAIAEAIEPTQARLKWPNDVLIDGRKVAGILVEAKPQEGWAVLGIGINVAIRPDDFPPQLQATAATLGLEPEAIEPMLYLVIAALSRWLAASDSEVLAGVRARDALLGQPVYWQAGSGTGAGIDGDGRLIVSLAHGGQTTLEAGEVHLTKREQ